MAKFKRHVFNFNEDTNGGEALLVTTELNEINEEPTQEICLMSYGNCASIHLGQMLLTPAALRNMADELENYIKYVKRIKRS